MRGHPGVAGGRACVAQRQAPGHAGPPSEGSGAPAFSLASSRKVPMFGLEAIWRNGQVVGHIRRADFGFTIDKTLAYGYIRDPSGGPVSRAPLPQGKPGSSRDTTPLCRTHPHTKLGRGVGVARRVPADGAASPGRVRGCFCVFCLKESDFGSSRLLLVRKRLWTRAGALCS